MVRKCVGEEILWNTSRNCNKISSLAGSLCCARTHRLQTVAEEVPRRTHRPLSVRAPPRELQLRQAVLRARLVQPVQPLIHSQSLDLPGGLQEIPRRLRGPDQPDYAADGREDAQDEEAVPGAPVLAVVLDYLGTACGHRQVGYQRGEDAPHRPEGVQEPRVPGARSTGASFRKITERQRESAGDSQTRTESTTIRNCKHVLRVVARRT